MPFPLPFVPKLAYSGPHAGRRYFKAPRPNGRRHAGCDLIAPLGTDIFAVADGIVVELSRQFYRGTSAIAIQHPSLPGMKGDKYIVRYCEILDRKHDSAFFGKLRLGSEVVAGQTIAKVGKMERDSMLHFELYSGLIPAGHLSMSSGRDCNAELKRRKDVIDPTPLLDELAKEVQDVMIFSLAETGVRA